MKKIAITFKDNSLFCGEVQSYLEYVPVACINGESYDDWEHAYLFITDIDGSFHSYARSSILFFEDYTNQDLNYDCVGNWIAD